MSTNPLQWIEPILDRYERPLLQYAASICGSAENARIVVQDTFVKRAKRGKPDASRLRRRMRRPGNS